MNFNDYEKTHVVTYTQFADLMRSILKDAISKTARFPRLQSTKARGKNAKSLKLKLKERRLLDSTHVEDEIKDLAGVRLIFYTNTDIDRFIRSGLIPDTFDVDWKETRIHHPTNENDQQRYQAIHYTVLLSDKHAALPQYSKFRGMRCEIQLQTVLNHAWAEAYHDMVYKARESPGFGTAARQALDKRMKRIMDEYLRPAGYEFQKVQHDYERLIQGEDLFERGEIETLEKCENNNERHDILSRIADYVIPNYDDPLAVFPKLCCALKMTVHAARNTEPTPIETPLDNLRLRGKTPQDVTAAAIRILDSRRYVDVAATFHTLSHIYKGERDEKIRKQIVAAIKRLAGYDLHVWRRFGPYVQMVLTKTLEELSDADRPIPRLILLTVWRELLEVDIKGTTSSAETMTFSTAAMPISEDIKLIRDKAIRGLTALFDSSSSGVEKAEIVSALREATRLPIHGSYSNELCQVVLQNTKTLAEFLTQRAPQQPYELLEQIERHMLFDYQRARQIAGAEQDAFGCKQIAETLAKSILAFRDLINTDQQFIRYKTLVGSFESAFSADWDHETFDYEAIEQYRIAQLPLYVDDISDDTAEEWHRLIQQCAATQSNDVAIFRKFLQTLSKAKPSFALALVRRHDQKVMRFLPEILTGLFESTAVDKYQELIRDYLNQDMHLTAIARHCRSTGKETAETSKRVLKRAIAVDEVFAVFEAIAFAIEYHDSQSLPLIEDVFVPAIKFLAAKKDARWVRDSWYLQTAEKFFKELSSKCTELVLTNLLALRRIDHHDERILTFIAENHPASVWTFLERRVAEKTQGQDRYEAIPYPQFQGLKQPLARSVDLAISTVRTWYKPGDYMFQFTGARVLHAVFPTFTDELAISLNKIVANGSDDDYEFAIHVLQNYHGDPLTHEVVKELIDRLPENDSKLRKLNTCLASIGPVWGEFGMVEAYRKKKETISSWLKDSRPRVREFAESYIRSMEQRIAGEQRSAEMENELMKRDYEIDE